MRMRSSLTVALLGATQLALALPSSSNLHSPLEHIEARGVKVSKRPNYPLVPHHPSKSFPYSPPRTKTCVVKNYGNGKDDSEYILSAIKECNDGGHVIFEQGKKYTIGTALDLTFLKHIDLGTC